MAYRGPDPKPESLTAQESLSGNSVNVTADNTSNTASSDAKVEAKVAGTSAGDPYHVAQIAGGEAFSWGIDNSDGDKFKLSDNATLGSNDVLEVNSSQIVTFTKALIVSSRINSVSGDYTVTDTDGYDTIVVDANGATRTVTLPTVADNAGREIIVKRVDSTWAPTNNCIVDGEGAETIDGAANWYLPFNYDYVKLVCGASEWHVVDYRAQTDWISFTPTGGWSTNTTWTGSFRRVGDSLEVDVSAATSGAPDAVGFTMTIPHSWTIDTGKVEADGWHRVGYGSLNDSSSTFYDIIMHYASSTTIAANHKSASSSFVTDLDVSQAAPFTFGSGDFVNFRALIPISNWRA